MDDTMNPTNNDVVEEVETTEEQPETTPEGGEPTA